VNLVLSFAREPFRFRLRNENDRQETNSPRERWNLFDSPFTNSTRGERLSDF